MDASLALVGQESTRLNHGEHGEHGESRETRESRRLRRQLVVAALFKNTNLRESAERIDAKLPKLC
jgi:hypothetical protein